MPKTASRDEQTSHPINKRRAPVACRFRHNFLNVIDNMVPNCRIAIEFSWSLIIPGMRFARNASILVRVN